MRNDGADGRTVAVDMVCDPAYGEVSMPRSAVHIRDAAVALTNAAWIALSDEGQVMALRHRSLDLRGLQFHPESVLTPDGAAIISNWLNH